MLAMEPSASKEIATPRPASTVLLVRDSAEGMEVFMVVRHHQIDFASGALVFPGGSIDKEDFAIAADHVTARCGTKYDTLNDTRQSAPGSAHAVGPVVSA